MFNYFTSAFWLDSPLWFPLELSCDDPLTQLSGGATNGKTMPCKPVSKGTNLTTRPTNLKLMKNSMKDFDYSHQIPWEGSTVWEGTVLIQGAATILWTIRYTRLGVFAGHNWAISPSVKRWRITRSSFTAPPTNHRLN